MNEGQFETPVRSNTMTAAHLAEEMGEAEKALLSRPSLSVRFRLIVGFYLCFVMSGIIAVAAFVILTNVKSKLQFLAITGELTSEIQQARRYESNFFARGTELQNAIKHTQTAASLFESTANDLLKVGGEILFNALSTELDRYTELLSRCEELEREGTWDLDYRSSIAKQLNAHGARVVDLTESLTILEAKSMNRMLGVFQIVPLVFLVVLLALIFYIVRFLSRAILHPLERFQDYTKRIANGDFSPIMPARRYRDEFSDLALAFNRMLIQLKTHEANCIQAAKMSAVGSLTSAIPREQPIEANNEEASREE